MLKKIFILLFVFVYFNINSADSKKKEDDSFQNMIVFSSDQESKDDELFKVLDKDQKLLGFYKRYAIGNSKYLGAKIYNLKKELIFTINPDFKIMTQNIIIVNGKNEEAKIEQKGEVSVSFGGNAPFKFKHTVSYYDKPYKLVRGEDSHGGFVLVLKSNLFYNDKLLLKIKYGFTVQNHKILCMDDAFLQENTGDVIAWAMCLYMYEEYQQDLIINRNLENERRRRGY